MIISKTPYRISLFGGGTDFEKWFKKNEGLVITTTIDKYCYISLRNLPDFYKYKTRLVWSLIEEVQNNKDIKHPVVNKVLKYYNYSKGLEIHYDADLPSRSGLGSSSSFTIGFLNAFYNLINKKIDKKILAKDSIFVEQILLKELGGVQDQIQIANGGFNIISINKKGEYNIYSKIDIKKLKNLKKYLLLFYTGVQRHSSAVTEITLQKLNSKAKNIEKIYQIAKEAKKILLSKKSNLEELGILMDESWRMKRDIHKNISNSEIDMAYNLAKKNGAIGGKILGSGGGGHFLLFAKPENHKKIIKSLKNFTNINFDFDNEGSKIIFKN